MDQTSLAVPELIHVNTDDLRLALVEAQFKLRADKSSAHAHGVLVLVSGIEMAGKGEAITQLREWMDPRYLQVKADVPAPLQDSQPLWQKYVSYLPGKGQLMVLFGNWYSDLLAAVMQGQVSAEEFDSTAQQLRQFEHDLSQNGTTIIKCWFDISWKCLQKRLDALDPSEQHWQQLHGLDWRNKAQYKTVRAWRQRLGNDWFVIDGQDEDQRDLTFAHLMLDALQTPAGDQDNKAPQPVKKVAIPLALQQPEQEKIEKKAYKSTLKKLQKKVARQLREQVKKAPVMIVFEGMDAAGKGGAIRRIVAKLDPREYEIHSIAAPEPFELRRPYLWRFWRRLPNQGSMSIFDRSWYGRVLVERLEGFASNVEWQRAYAEINRFEQQLSDRGCVVIKIWLAISNEEQLARFKAREVTPHKQFKITEEDWRNRDKWDDYLQAAADMLALTSTQDAPWYVVATDDKKSARVQVLEAVLAQLKATQKNRQEN